jgi:hypothetical protein
LRQSLSNASWRHVLGLRIVLHHAPRDGQNGRQMPIDQAAKSLRFARRNTSKQLRLVVVVVGPDLGSGPDPLFSAST